MEHERTMLSAQDLYEATGDEKWREFIDGKDQDAAIQETTEGLLKHPGEYYNWHRDPSGRTGTGDHWTAFQKASNYVSDSIVLKKPLNFKEYYAIHMLAASGYESEFKKGWRDKEVTWGLANVTEEKTKNLQAKGLQVRNDRGSSGATVVVPEPDNTMEKLVQALFEQYAKEKEADSFIAAVKLYVQLEALHPTKDASSRTNHLILNRLLAEQGKAPAIIQEPNTPELSEEEALRMVQAASDLGQKFVLQQGLQAEEIQKRRKARKAEEEKQRKMEEMMRKMGLGKK